MAKVTKTNNNNADKLHEDTSVELDKLINISSTYKTEVRKTCANLIESGKIDDMFDYLDRFVVSLEVALTDQTLGEAEPAARDWLDKFFVRVEHLHKLCRNGSGLNPVCPIKIRNQITGDEDYVIPHLNRNNHPRGNRGFRHRERESTRGRRDERFSRVVEVDTMPIGWNDAIVTSDRYDYETVMSVYNNCKDGSWIFVNKDKKQKVISMFAKLHELGSFYKINYLGTHLLVYRYNDNPNSMRIVYLDSKSSLAISHVGLPAQN